MKLGRKAWLQVHAIARGEGFDGAPVDVEDCKKFLVSRLIPTLTIDEKTVEVKTLEVEMSEDETQVLVTEVQPTQQQPPQNPPPQQPPQQQANLEISEAVIKARVEKALKDLGVDLATGKRPPNLDDVRVEVTPADEAPYNARAKRGGTVFKDGATAKAFDSMLKAKACWRAGEQAGAKQHEDFVHKVAKHRGLETKAMATTPGSAGGALTEAEFAPEIIRLVEEYGIITRLVAFRDLPQQQVTYKRRTGGTTIYHPNENTAITQSNPTYDNVTLTAKTAAALTQISNQLLLFATPDAGDEAARELSRDMAKYIDDSVFGGNGSGGPTGLGVTLPGREGFYNKFGAAASDGGYIVVGAGTASAHTTAQLSNLLGRVPVYARQGMVATGSPVKIAAILDRLARSAGGVTMQEITGFGMVKSWGGIPFVENFSDVNGSTLDQGGAAIDLLMGNFGLACKVHRKNDVEFDVSDQRYFDEYATAVRAVLNWDFVVHDVGDADAAGPVVSFWQS